MTQANVFVIDNVLPFLGEIDPNDRRNRGFEEHAIPYLYPNRLRTLTETVITQYPGELRHGDVVMVYLTSETDRPPDYYLFYEARQGEEPRLILPYDNPTSVPSSMSVPTEFPPSWWRLRDTTQHDKRDMVRAVFGNKYGLYLPFDRPFTRANLYTVRDRRGETLMVLPINVNGHVYYVVSLNDDDLEGDGDTGSGRAVESFLQLVNAARQQVRYYEIQTTWPIRGIDSKDIIAIRH